MMLALPSVDGVRLATLRDLHRIAIVAAAAFYWSPTFRFQRPRYKDFPSDTIASYWIEYEAAIKDPSRVVLVAEDVLDKDEAQHVYEALQSAYRDYAHQQPGIVGICSLSLKPGTCYGRLQAQSTHMAPEYSSMKLTVQAAEAAEAALNLSTHRQFQLDDLKRDQCTTALQMYEASTGPAKLKSGTQSSKPLLQSLTMPQAPSRQYAPLHFGGSSFILAPRTRF